MHWKSVFSILCYNGLNKIIGVQNVFIKIRFCFSKHTGGTMKNYLRTTYQYVKVLAKLLVECDSVTTGIVYETDTKFIFYHYLRLMIFL